MTMRGDREKECECNEECSGESNEGAVNVLGRMTGGEKRECMGENMGWGVAREGREWRSVWGRLMWGASPRAM